MIFFNNLRMGANDSETFREQAESDCQVANGADNELPGADIHGGNHRDEPREVEPGRRPPPTSTTEDRGPVIESSRRREG